jgi:hypothetical protein
VAGKKPAPDLISVSIEREATMNVQVQIEIAAWYQGIDSELLEISPDPTVAEIYDYFARNHDRLFALLSEEARQILILETLTTLPEAV